MRVLLVNPDYEIERYMGRHFGRMGWVMPPMGLLYLAAQLEAEGIEVAVYDAQVDERSLDDALTEFEPAIVGITCATALVASTLAAARIAKERFPGVTVVVGGVHPTVRPDDLLTGDHVDIAVRGEGLLTLVEIARVVDTGRSDDLETIKGISYRQDNEATIRFSRRLPLDQVRFALATPFPGTRLWEIAKNEGSVEIDDWMQLSSMGGYRSDELFYVPVGRDSDELKRLQRRANFSFYFRPRIMAGFIRRIRSMDEFGEYARGAWGLLKATVAPY